jgi:hypothetical protein
MASRRDLQLSSRWPCCWRRVWDMPSRRRTRMAELPVRITPIRTSGMMVLQSAPALPRSRCGCGFRSETGSTGNCQEHDLCMVQKRRRGCTPLLCRDLSEQVCEGRRQIQYVLDQDVRFRGRQNRPCMPDLGAIRTHPRTLVGHGGFRAALEETGW